MVRSRRPSGKTQRTNARASRPGSLSPSAPPVLPIGRDRFFFLKSQKCQNWRCRLCVAACSRFALCRGVCCADYLEEIGRLTFAFDDSKDVFNFAEAALLIQGERAQHTHAAMNSITSRPQLKRIVCRVCDATVVCAARTHSQQTAGARGASYGRWPHVYVLQCGGRVGRALQSLLAT